MVLQSPRSHLIGWTLAQGRPIEEGWWVGDLTIRCALTRRTGIRNKIFFGFQGPCSNSGFGNLYISSLPRTQFYIDYLSQCVQKSEVRRRKIARNSKNDA